MIGEYVLIGYANYVLIDLVRLLCLMGDFKADFYLRVKLNDWSNRELQVLLC